MKLASGISYISYMNPQIYWFIVIGNRDSCPKYGNQFQIIFFFAVPLKSLWIKTNYGAILCFVVDLGVLYSLSGAIYCGGYMHAQSVV